MPAELDIILAIVIGAIWLLAKIVQGIAAFLDAASKDYDAAAAKRKQNRYSRGRDRLRQYVRVLMPDELDGFEKKSERVRIEFEQAQRLTEWVALPPGWEKDEFQSLVRPRKDSRYSEMCIDDIEAILNPNPDISTWSYEESKIISRRCKYSP